MMHSLPRKHRQPTVGKFSENPVSVLATATAIRCAFHSWSECYHITSGRAKNDYHLKSVGAVKAMGPQMTIAAPCVSYRANLSITTASVAPKEALSR